MSNMLISGKLKDIVFFVKRTIIRTVFLSILASFGQIMAQAAPSSSSRVSLPPHYMIVDLGAGEAIDILENGEVLGTFTEGVKSGEEDKVQDWVLRGGQQVPITPQEVARLTKQSPMPGSVTRSGIRVACVLRGGKVQFLAVPAGVTISSVEAVNRTGQAVGFCVSGYGRHAALWNLHTPGALPQILQPPVTSISDATSINDAGQVVGTAKLINSQNEFGFVWHGGRFRDLGSLGSRKTSNLYPVRINRLGQVVGDESDWVSLKGGQFNAKQYPFLWQQGHLYELGKLLESGSDWRLLNVEGLNDRGQVVGIGYHHHQRRVFLLTPSAGIRLKSNKN